MSHQTVFDQYIPFTTELLNTPLSLPLYWRTGDKKYSLMEIGLNRDAGVLQSITLTCINSQHVQKQKKNYELSASVQLGQPVFDITPWENRDNFDDFANNFIDEFTFELSFTLGLDFLSLSIESGMEAVQLIKNDNIIFGMNVKGALTQIDIIGLSQEDIKNIEIAVSPAT